MAKAKADDGVEVLPLEIISKILTRLPVRVLVRFTLVCRLWYSFIRSPKLINTLIKNHKFHTDDSILFMPSTLTRLQQDSSCHLMRPDASYTSFDIPVVYSNFNLSFVGNSCLGLLCFTNNGGNDSFYGRMVYLYNPSIRKLKLISHDRKVNDARDNCVYTRLGFGYCESSKDFKVVRIHYVDKIVMTQPPQVVEIYSLNADCWRQITAPANGIGKPDLESISCNGVIYWWAEYIFSRFYFVILSFDLTSEEFNVIRLSSNLTKPGKLLSYNGQLAMFHDFHQYYQRNKNVPELWLMEKRDDNTCSSSKVYKCGAMARKGVEAMARKGVEAMARKGVEAIGFTSTGKLLIRMLSEDRFAYWDPEKDLLKIVDASSNTSFLDYHVEASFVETLVLFGGTDVKGAQSELVKKPTSKLLPNGTEIYKLKIHDDDMIVRIATNDEDIDCGVEELKNACDVKKLALVVITGMHTTRKKCKIQLTTQNYSMVVERRDGDFLPESLARFLANPSVCFVVNTSDTLCKVFPMFSKPFYGTNLRELLVKVKEKRGSGSVCEVNVVGRCQDKECNCLWYGYYKTCHKLLCLLLQNDDDRLSKANEISKDSTT